jgi:hypothetical protein
MLVNRSAANQWKRQLSRTADFPGLPEDRGATGHTFNRLPAKLVAVRKNGTAHAVGCNWGTRIDADVSRYRLAVTRQKKQPTKMPGRLQNLRTSTFDYSANAESNARPDGAKSTFLTY